MVFASHTPRNKSPGMSGLESVGAIAFIRRSNPAIQHFLFCGYVKQIFYSVGIHNIRHLKQPIRKAAASVTAYVLDRV
jgi:hypothetical protein